MPETTTETTVELNGVRLYTRRVGHGPPVVVLHGGPGAHHDYLLPQYDHLAEGGRTLLYYDQRGGGRSPVPRDVPVGWREHVVDLEALRGHWELDRLTLIGYSWGGLLALLYALEHPDRIARLALVSSAPVTAAWRDEFERRFAARMAQPWIARSRADLVASGLSRTDPEKYRRIAFALSVAGYFRDPSRAREMTPFRVTERTRRGVWDSLGNYDLREQIHRTFPDGTAPRSLLLHGVYDPMPLEAARETAALRPSGANAAENIRPRLASPRQASGLGLVALPPDQWEAGVRGPAAVEGAGGLAALPRFGAKTAENIRRGIASLRRASGLRLFHHAWDESEAVRRALAGLEDGTALRVEIAGAVRRRCEVIGALELVAVHAGPAARETLVRRLGQAPGVTGITRREGTVTLRFASGTLVDVLLTTPDRFGLDWIRATGSPAHLAWLESRARAMGVSWSAPFPDEPSLYRALGLAWVPPELREGNGELEAAAYGGLPRLVEQSDLRGLLHCHSNYSDG